MKKHVNIILVLMSLCVTGIIGLQLFWNYQNYQRTVNAFQHDINQTLQSAVDAEKAQRHEQLITKVKGWLADTSLIQITCDTKNQDSNTVFHIKDRHPKFVNSQSWFFGLADFKPKLTRLPPDVKAMVINRFSNTTVRKDLREGIVYFYTRLLGDSLVAAFDKSHVRMNVLDGLYKTQLLSKGIHTSFRLNPADTTGNVYLTQSVNTSLRGPYKKELVRAAFESLDWYFLKTMKWVLLTTLLLIGISLLCFGYTAKTLLSQHKLAQLKDDFINNMTHELNTPLASIKITTEALKTFSYTPDVQHDYLDIIQYQTEKLTDLTARILNTNRLITANQDEWQPIDLSPLLDKAIQGLSTHFTAQQATLVYRPVVTPLLVYGQADSLLNAFTNILDNALKYASPNLELDIKLIVNSRWVEIAFADNGIGIPAEYRAKVFEPFFRVPQGKVHDVKGYGLGLNYVRQVINQHRGSITVQANQPCGSLFSINLPLL